MEDITLDPDDPAEWLWSFNDASLFNKHATSDLLQAGLFFYHARAISLITTHQPSATATTTSVTQRPPPVSAPDPNPPAVASAYSSVSPSPFAPPSRSSSNHQTSKAPEREIVGTRDTEVIPTGDDPATSEYVSHASESHEDDSQANPGDNDDRDPSQVCPSVLPIL
jgi:hypothetical protein